MATLNYCQSTNRSLGDNPPKRWRNLGLLGTSLGCARRFCHAARMDVRTLIERAETGLDGDAAWLSSEGYRSLIDEFVSSRVPTATVRWLRPGDRSYQEGSVLALERPAADAGLDAVEPHALVVLHEVLHLVHSDHLGARALATALSEPPAFRRRLGTDVFNHLEDARVAAREHEFEPGNDPYVERLHLAALQQEEQDHAEQEGAPPWSVTPRRVFPQLRLAIIERLLVGDRGSERSPIVRTVLQECEPAFRAGIASQTTQGARDATLEVIHVVSRHWTELVADLRQ